MKTLIYLFLTSFFLVTISCNEPTPNSTQDETTPLEQEKPISLKTITEYGIDSLSKAIYQIDENTNTKHGWFKQYGENGNILLERSYIKNKAEGVEKSYYSSGKLESNMMLSEGKYHGKFTYYFEDGTLKQEGEFVNDKMEGTIKTYYSNGNLKEEVLLVANMTQGPFKEYNENGTLKTEGNYNSKEDREELETGELKKYDDNGVLIEKMLCKDGQCCKTWTKKEGDIKPSSDYCASIIESVKASKSEKVQ